MDRNISKIKFKCLLLVISITSPLILAFVGQSYHIRCPQINPITPLSMALFDKVSGRDLKIASPDGSLISYDYFTPETGSSGPPIVYLPGLVRQKNEAKSINLRALCKKNALTYLGADYYGVGRSEGKFEEGSITRWTDDTIYLIDKVLKGKAGNIPKVIFVGHGLGGWIAFLIAKKRPDLVSGIVGLSVDADFTEELLWKDLSDEIKEKIMNEGRYEITWGTEKYPITRNLIEDGRKNLLLAGGKGSVPVTCPVRLIHGLNDEEVPFDYAQRLAESITSRDVGLMLMKDAKHSMEGEEEFKVMRQMIDAVMLAFTGEFDLRSPASG